MIPVLVGDWSSERHMLNDVYRAESFATIPT
jgi:hypothetical protein